MEGPISLQSPAFLKLAQEVLSRGLSFRFSAPGTSMSPLIRDGDVLTLAPITGGSVGMGDIVAFALPNEGRLVVHRVVRREGDGYLTKGDNGSGTDGIIPFDCIVGTVVGIERDGTRVYAGLGPERSLIALLSRWNYLRSVIGVGAPVVRTLRRLF